VHTNRYFLVLVSNCFQDDNNRSMMRHRVENRGITIIENENEIT
jgi:hypothetical protein